MSLKDSIKVIELKNQAKGTASQAGRRWWLLEPDEAAVAISANVGFWNKNQTYRHAAYIRFARAYGNLPGLGFFANRSSKVAALRTMMGPTLTFNVTQSVVDSLTASIARNKPKPLFLTNDGNYRQRNKAKMLTKFSDGVFYENDTQKLMRDAFRDACILGDGIIHVYEGQDGRVHHERVLPLEIWVDDQESEMSTPRQMHRVKYVDRAVLLDMFPDKVDVILRDQSCNMLPGAQSYQNLSDLVAVRESWHLPSGPDSEDGAHILTLEKDALTEMEPWTHDCFPFAKFSYSRRQIGFWSQGLAEQVSNIQLEINKLLAVVQKTLHLGGTIRWWVQTGSDVVVQHINNDIGSILKSNTAPQDISLRTLVQPEIYQQIEALKSAAYNQAGISQLAATSLKPAGLNSGTAIREYNDIGTERFMVTGLQYEDFSLEIAKLSIMTVRDIIDRANASSSEDSPKIGYSVRSPSKGSVQELDWKDIGLDKDEDFVLQCFPISSLPSDPAGRLQAVQDYMQAGIIDQATGRDLLDFPDTGFIEGLANAMQAWTTKVLDEILDNGKYIMPDPHMDLSMAHQLGLEYYARSQKEDQPESRLGLLRQWIKDCEDGIQAAAPPPPPQAQPTGVPGQPPTAELSPTVPQQ